jgi:ubiquinone biosynthesis protein
LREEAETVMSIGAFQIDPQDLAGVVPDCYAEFRPVVADGLTFFLRHLSPPRLTEVFAAQAALPADADLPRRLVLFLHACPALHKIGQVVARNRHLDLELCRHLQGLESLEPRTQAEEWRPALSRALAPAVKDYRIHTAARPLAEGSVAVVVPLTWSDPAEGANAPRQHGVAKLLKPGVVERLDEDLRILGQLAGYLEERWAAYGLPSLAYREVLDEVAELLTSEVDLRLEQVHLARAASQFTGKAGVWIPRLLPFCTDIMTAMERVHGSKVTDPHAVAAWQRPALLRTTVRALLGDVLFSRDESVLFHGDPHAGNLLATPDGRLAVLDWSLAGRLTAGDRVQVMQILLGGLARDARRITDAVATLARGSNEDVVGPRVEAALAELPWYTPPGPAWVMTLLDSLAHAGVRFPPHLLLFRKAYLTLQGVLADVFSLIPLETVLMAEGLTRFAWEWPLRWWKPLTDHDYATHVSTADLVRLAFHSAGRFNLPAVLGH